MHPRTLTFAMVVMVMIGGAEVASAQSTVDQTAGASCKSCAHNLDTNEHFFNGWFGCSGGGTCKDCNVFNSCHGDPQQPFSCDEFHWACGTTLSALDAVDRAMKYPFGDAGIVRVASAIPEHVSVVAAGYLIVRGCFGEIVASYKVTPATLARIVNKKEVRHVAVSLSLGELLGVRGAS